jgi:hypothetical protein
MRKRRRLGRVDKLYRRSCHERRRRGGGGGSDLFVFNDTIERPSAPGTAHERERERERGLFGGYAVSWVGTTRNKGSTSKQKREGERERARLIRSLCSLRFPH